MADDTVQADQNEQHLRLLSIFHYVVGAIVGLFSCLPILHMVIGIAFIVSPESMNGPGGPIPEMFGWMFALMGGLFVLAGWSVAICILLAGRFISHRRRYTFCLIIAGVECLFMPFGTVLGVLTLIVLTKAEVKDLFNGGVSRAH